jgi:BirA family transcriptional regulator, biotin operon repressor / biotin---[acetyl-CoA-carboxylase] ligase
LPSPNNFNLDALRQGLKPFRLHFFPRLRSTNDHAAVLRKRGDLFAPAVVVAARQTAGRGRGANTWYSAPAGSITITFILPVNGTLAPHHLPLAAGLAVRNAAAEISRNDQIQLKWPNDLVYQSKLRKPQSPIQKLAGLLCERLDNVDLIGIGLNVNSPPRPLPRNLRDRIIYLQQIPPHSGLSTQKSALDLTAVLITIARHLHTTLIRKSETPFPTLLREYDAHHALIGRSVTVISPDETPVSGKCFGLDDTGRLLLRNRRHVHRIIAGHVELTR